MIPENAQLHELPVYWQERIQRLRGENMSLRRRLRDAPRLADQGLPPNWQKELTSTRRENARLRVERNQLRDELACVRDSWEQLSADAYDLWRGINPRSGAPLVAADYPNG